jgi:hypothetical protein
VARAVARTAGLLEMRGLGIVRVEHEPAAVVRLIVECGPGGAPRYPKAAERQALVRGVRLPRIACDPNAAVARILVWRGLDGLDEDVVMTVR